MENGVSPVNKKLIEGYDSMNKLKLVLLLSFGLVVQSTTAYTQVSNALFVKDGGFALALKPMGDKYPIIAFLPTGFLLFEPDSKQIIVGNDYYRQVTTQDGVRLYALQNKISKESFSKTFGTSGIIFNSQYKICQSPGCDRKNDNSTTSINPGNVFVVEDLPTNQDFFQLKGKILTPREEVVGVISKSDLVDLNKKGIVTRSDQEHPRYHITPHENFIADTQCGDVKKSSDPLSPSDDNEKHPKNILIPAVFSLGTVSNNKGNLWDIKVKKTYGEKDKSFKHYLYEIYDRKEKKGFLIAAQATFACSWNVSKEELNFIENVNLIKIQTEDADGNSQTTLFYSYPFSSFKDDGKIIESITIPVDLKKEPPITYELSAWDTPKNLQKNVSGPYMWSVNTQEQYFQLMDRLGKMFDDRSLAGFFLAVFNKSCKAIDRTNLACNGHSYNIPEK
jgi:hypothetical protein